VSTNFIPYEEWYKNEISYPSFKYLTAGTKAWENYVFYDINDVIKYEIDGSLYLLTFKELMLQEPYVDVFSKLVYSNSDDISSTKSRSSIVYFNNYKNSIDTIINGLNLSFFLDENAKNNFNIQDWDKFRISFVSTASRNRDNNYPIEIFINENTKTILIVWYQGCDELNYNRRFSSHFGGKSLIEDSSYPREFQSFKNNDRYWSYMKSPFIVNHYSVSSDITNIFGTDVSYESSICSPNAQLNWNFGDSVHSIFNAYGPNEVTNSSFEFLNRQYNTFKGYVDYTYLRDSGTYGDGVMNYGYTYMNNNNIYDDLVCSLELFKHIIELNNIGYYIFRENLVYSNSNFLVPPVIITINDPREYRGIYTYNGWYRPKFNNLLEFNSNEDSDIIETLETDFIFSNTNLNGYNNIPQLWYNKIVTQVSENDVSIKNAISYIEDFNIFKSQWDRDYYILDDALIDGYYSTLELPSYFGSKLIRLPDYLDLDQWDITTASSTDGKNWHTLKYNLTRKIVNIFKSNSIFTGNWESLTTSDNIIDGYIKKTILGYYNISKQKIKVETWTKPYNGNRISYQLDSTFSLNSASNVDALLNFENGEYLYKIKVPLIPNLTYFVKFRLFEK
jgi:hypothetical protein